jgi:hypothetical protein
MCDANLLEGASVCLSTWQLPPPVVAPSAVSLPSLLRSVVLIGVWDSRIEKMRPLGSGFVVDQQLGWAHSVRYE